MFKFVTQFADPIKATICRIVKITTFQKLLYRATREMSKPNYMARLWKTCKRPQRCQPGHGPSRTTRRQGLFRAGIVKGCHWSFGKKKTFHDRDQ